MITAGRQPRAASWQAFGTLQISIFACVLVALVTACARSKYRYISMKDVPGIEVVEYGRPRLKAIRGASSMPTEYRLERERYRLELRINLETYAPALVVRTEAKGTGLGVLHLVAQRSRKTPAASVAPCGSFYEVTGSPNQLSFGWACKDGDEGRFISFDVLTTAGQLVGEEDLPFELEENGYYFLPDLL
jgi:hypothetical protein